jgi:hypothetical protein
MFNNFIRHCGVCNKKKFHVAYRSYNVPSVSPKPIVSTEKLCRMCYKDIKRKVINTIK